MSRHTRRARIEELTEELCIGAAMQLRCNSDEIRATVVAVVAYLVSVYPSQDLFIPATVAPPGYPVARMRAELAEGRTVRSICKRYRVSSKTLYQLLGEGTSATG